MNQNIDYTGVGQTLAAYRRSKRVHRCRMPLACQLLEDGRLTWSHDDTKSAVIAYLDQVDALAAER